jgi:O-antigen/teichoic acid export membrane protein
MSNSSYVARNFLSLGSGEMISRVIAFGVTIYLARILGAEGYGVIAFAAGVTLYLSKIADFSIEVIGTREIASDPGSVNQLASAVMSVRLLLAALLTGGTILTAQVFLSEPDRTIFTLYFLILIPIAANTKWIHLGLENARPIGLSRIAGEALALIIVLGIVRGREELWGAPVAQVAGEFLFAFLMIFVLRRRNYKFSLRWDLKTALPLFTKALPLLGQAILWLLIYNSDLIFLRLFRNSESVGYYAAAYALICFIANVGLSYGMSLLPTLTRLGVNTDEEKSLYQTALVHVYVVCLPISIGGFLLASQIINLSFGDGYTYSILVLQVLFWCIPPSLLRTVPWAALIARGHQRLLLRVMGYSVIVNIVLNILLIPIYGMLGAAVATVITETLSGVLMFKYAANYDLSFAPLRRFWRPTVACFFMAGGLSLLRPATFLVGFAVGFVVYFLFLKLVGGIQFRKGQLPVLDV